MSSSGVLIKNSLFSGAGYVLVLFISLFLTPYIISKLGLELFGVFVFLEVVVNYCSLIDIAGVNGAFVKYISEFHAKKEDENLNHIVNFGLSYYLVFWLTISIIVLWFRSPLLNIFSFPESIDANLNFLLLGILGIATIRGTFAIFRSTLLGLQKHGIATAIQVTSSFLNLIGTVVALELGTGIQGLVINGIGVAIITVILQLIFSIRLIPTLKIRLFVFNKDIAKNAFFYGTKIQVSRFATMINTHIDKLLLGHFTSMTLVGAYEVGSKIANLGRAFPYQLSSAILPAAAHLDSVHDDERQKILYYRATKYFVILSFPITGYFASNAHWIVQFWLNQPGLEMAVLALQFLCFAYTFELLANVARLVARGLGVPQFEMHASFIMAGLNIALSVILIINFGFIGALVATTISGFVGSAYLLLSFHSYWKEPFHTTVLNKIYPIPFVSTLLATAGTFFLTRLLGTNFININQTRSELFLPFLCVTFVFGVIYFSALILFRYADEYDKHIFRKTIGMIFNK